MIAIASDHAGYNRKQQICKWLKKQNIEFVDLGTNSNESVDYPVYAQKLAEQIENSKCEYGILICGSGIGMSIAVNRNKHVRGALCVKKQMAVMSRRHNNANVLCLPARTLCFLKTKSIIKAFLNTKFDGGRHQKRIDLMS